jgi:hypothetical protein
LPEAWRADTAQPVPLPGHAWAEGGKARSRLGLGQAGTVQPVGQV